MSSVKQCWKPTLFPEDLDHILAHTGQIWEPLRGQRVFITGGTGFFGHWLLESLLWADDHYDLDIKVALLSRNPQRFTKKYPQISSHPALSWITGDVKAFEFPEGEFAYVIHAASEGDARLSQENPRLVYDTIVEGTQRILEFARTHHTKTLLFISSGAVYGKQPAEITHIPEEYQPAAELAKSLSTYGQAKRTAEQLCSSFSQQYGIEIKIARCFAFVGPYLPMDANFAIGNFIRDAINGGPIVITGDGTPYRSYLYAADLAIWLWTILFNGRSCQPYNVGSDLGLEIKELAELVRDTLRPGIEIQVMKSVDSNHPRERYVPSINLGKKELGLRGWIPLRDGIEKMSNWLTGKNYL